MRLIDADALIDDIKNCLWDWGSVDGITATTVLKQTIADIENQPIVSSWVSVKERMPESGKHVLLTCEIRCIDGFKKRYVCDGFYSKAHTLPQGHYLEDDEAYDYDEDEDEYYLKEGWYEVIHNWDDYSSVVIYDFVTHWRSLPEPAQEGTDERTD